MLDSSVQEVNLCASDGQACYIFCISSLQIEPNEYVLFYVTTIRFQSLLCVQVWALQEGGDVHVGGKSNRAVVMFAQELEEVLEDMPERLVPAVDKPAVKAVPENGSS